MAADELPLFDFDDVPGKSNPATGQHYPSTPPPAPGQGVPRDGQVTLQVREGNLYAFDWAVGRQVMCVVPPDGVFTIRAKTLAEVIRAVRTDAKRQRTPDPVLVGESTFNSYDVRQRQADIDLARSLGVTLLTVPARGNKRRREAIGLAGDKAQSLATDKEDAQAIRHAALNGMHLKIPVLVEPEWEDLRIAAAGRLRDLRRTQAKEGYARGLIQHLPPYTHQTSDRRIALGPKDGYNEIIVAAVGVATEFVSSRKDFERLMGFYAHGYPSQFRSDLMHWGWNRQPEKRKHISISVYRRELRWLFHELRATPPGQRESRNGQKSPQVEWPEDPF